MIIKNYEELKDFFENNYDKNQEDFINAHESGRYKIFDSERLILKFDDDGNYTSYPNEKLRKSKTFFALRRAEQTGPPVRTGPVCSTCLFVCLAR